KFTGGWNISNPAIGDVDGDGLNEVVTVTREGNLFVWDTTAPAGAEEWPKKRHDLRNTGNYEEPQGQTTNPTSTTTPGMSTPTTTRPCAYSGSLTVRRARLRLDPGASNDRLVIRATVVLAGGSDGITPPSQGAGVSLDALRFDLPPGVFAGQPRRW